MKKVLCAILFAFLSTITAQDAVKPELAPIKNVSNEYHGVSLEDPYQYMEDLANPDVHVWMKSNANYANSVLNSISGRKELFEKMKELMERQSSSIFNVRITDNDVYYYLKRKPGEEIGKMYKRDGYTGKETLFFDPVNYSTDSEKLYTVSAISPNIKGDKIAVSISPNGSENDEVIIFNENGKQFDETLLLAQEVSWLKSGDSFYYNRLNSADVTDVNRQKNTKVFAHVIGTDQSSDMEYFSSKTNPELQMDEMEFPIVYYDKVANLEVALVVSVDKRLKLYAKDSNNWKTIAAQKDEVINVETDKNNVYYLTFKDAPNYRITKAPITNPSFSNSETVVNESENEIITEFKATKDGLYYVTIKNGVEAKVYYLANNKKEAQELKLPFTAGQAFLTNKNGDFSDIWVTIAGWTSPYKRLKYNPKTNSFIHEPLSAPVAYPELDNLIAKEVMVKSHDGVMVPVSIVHNKDLKMDGNNPTVIYGYGSYGNSINPFFSPITLAFTLYNGVLVIPHVRGGGELGDGWHKAGQKLNKPNTWKDAIATAEYLIDEKYTNSNKLSIFGGSAGGIFVGRSITERPDLFTAAAPMVGAMNTVRMEETPNGPVNAPEFGTVKDPLEFKGLLEMDSYHHVKDNTAYPATLITAGINDPRVIAWQPAKFAARIQTANTSDKPILFLTNFEGGHGGRTTITDTLDEFSNVFSFFYWQSGHPDFQIKTPVKN
ncbi:prolyl oligopeptidase family serine peptidase [Lacinutrix himadriensis]|uniref:prolyl oligopeptidase family serine peptidase n=1 Tax=Lacinutrix himadriensis TaxID=641549 RepID=UPI0006E13281|nr:prolyl oligopeptidase family serine peptidase [Lacinutrix himadriensis]